MENFIVETLMPLLQALAMAGITAGIAIGSRYIQATTGIVISKGELEQLQNIAMKAVHTVEARAERKLLKKAGEWKHSQAVDEVLASAKNMSHSDAKHWVDWGVSTAHKLGGIGN